MYFKFNKILLFLLLVGINREVSSESCILERCLNGGTYNTNTQSCKCKPWYIGARCEVLCELGWTWKPDKCYFISTTTATWEDARTACQPYGNLVEINDASENDFLKRSSSGEYEYWIGLTDQVTEGTFIWNTSNKVVTYSDWWSQTSNNNPGEDCVRFLTSSQNQQWNDQSCVTSLRYICETADFDQNPCLNYGKYNEASQSCECAHGYTGETCGEKCKPGWKWHGNKCYFVSSTASNWSDAMTACAAMSNGMLVEVNDAEENSFLKTLLSDDKTYWMGLRRFDYRRIFVWDSSNVIPSYEDWASGEPNYGIAENCVHFFDKAKGQQWNDVHCSSRKNYICETRDYCNGNPCLNGGAYNEENNTCICRMMDIVNYGYRAYEGDACECKPGSRFDGNCYYISTDRRTWNDAMTACGPSMHLVDLGSEYEGGMLKHYLGDYEYWVGLTDEGHEGTYVWNWSLTLPSYTDWYAGQPTDSLGNENCVYLNRAYKNHTWNDGPCSSKLRYICEGELS